MNYIEVNLTQNVCKKDIICVEKIDEMSCKVYTSIGSYDCIYPSWRILMLLEQPDIEEQVVQTKSPVDRINLWGVQHFAG